MLEVAVDLYPPFDLDAARAWTERAVVEPNTLCLRSDNAFCIVTVTALFWEPTNWQAKLLFLANRSKKGLEGLKLLRTVASLTTKAGLQFHFGSETAADLAPLARRLGAKTARPSFVLEAPNGRQHLR